MRTLTIPASAKLAQNCGTESIIIVEIQWVSNGGIFSYADRKITGVRGQIVEIGSIDSAVKTDGSSDSSQVSLTLEDTDGQIKALCDQHDLHKRPVRIYQWFDGLALNERQAVGLNDGISGGTFTLTYRGQTTGAIDYTATASDVATALRALSNLEDADVTVTGGPGPTADWVVEFTPAAAELLIGDGANLTYHAFNGPPGDIRTVAVLTDKFLLFKGEINSPFVWDEGARTVSFDVTTKIEDVEAGFSMEEGDFPIIPPTMLGKAWPLVFGHVCDVKAVQVRAPRRGILQSGEGIRDYTLESRICQAGYITCADQPTGALTSGNSTQICWGGIVGMNAGGCVDIFPSGVAGDVGKDTSGPDQSCLDDAHYTVCDLQNQLSQQQAYEHATMTILGGADLFPQNQTITLNIGGGKFTGMFSGDVFTIASRVHPDFEVNPPTECVFIGDRSFQTMRVMGGSTWIQTTGGNAWYNPIGPNRATYCTDPGDGEVQISTDGPAASQKAYDDMATSSFFWARAGSEVYMESEAEVLYIVNLLPCTVLRVAAMKQTNFGPKLMTVPASYYTLYETDYDGYVVTEIGMTKPLSQQSEMVTNPDGTKRLVASKWTDDLYVTVTSSVGPNPVDIIAWLIGKYTSLSIDSISFAHVWTCLANYPVGFALLARKNVMDLVADIAVQSRCVVYVRNDVVYLKYFSEEPTSAGTITASDVLANSLQVTLSSTDEVVTKHIITWSRSQSEGELKVILKHNVAKYGTHEKDHAYTTHNIYDNLLKSATFWAIREANVWKLVQFSTPLKWLALEVFDCVALDLPEIAPTPVKAVITAAKYNVAQEQIDWTCWTPLRAGEATPYIHAWPAYIPAGTIFPTAEERLAGLGYGFTVAPPEGHLLYVMTEDDGQPPAQLTSGDPLPSDYDDVLETCFCPVTDDAYVDEIDPVFVALKKAQKADQAAQQAQLNHGSSGGGGHGGKKPEDKPDDKDKKPHSPDDPSKPKPKPKDPATYPKPPECIYEVEVTIITPTLVCGDCDCWGQADAEEGLVAISDSVTVHCTFPSYSSACAFASQAACEIQSHMENCPDGGGPVIWGTLGESFPTVVGAPVNMSDNDDPCRALPADPTAPRMIYNPYFDNAPSPDPSRGPDSVT
jgi:hypothetical protein